jgi:hypothetical protein
VTVALLYNERPAWAEDRLPDDTFEEYDDPATVCHIARALRRSGVTRDAVVAAARGAWCAVEARGYLRVDIRLDEAEAPYVLDVNPNPELGAGVGICRAVQEAGWTWERFVRQQVDWA